MEVTCTLTVHLLLPSSTSSAYIIIAMMPMMTMIAMVAMTIATWHLMTILTFCICRHK